MDMIEAAADIISQSEKLVVFTGAGISTESGIPDFRSPGGVWSKFDPNEYTYQKFLASEDYCNQINDSADNCAPVKKLCYTDRFLNNPQYPEEDFNRIFRDEMEFARSVELSKFVNPFVADRIFRRYVDLMRNRELTPEEAMSGATEEINQAMADYVAKRPALNAEYTRLTRTGPKA